MYSVDNSNIADHIYCTESWQYIKYLKDHDPKL